MVLPPARVLGRVDQAGWGPSDLLPFSFSVGWNPSEPLFSSTLWAGHLSRSCRHPYGHPHQEGGPNSPMSSGAKGPTWHPLLGHYSPGLNVRSQPPPHCAPSPHQRLRKPPPPPAAILLLVALLLGQPEKVGEHFFGKTYKESLSPEWSGCLVQPSALRPMLSSSLRGLGGQDRTRSSGVTGTPSFLPEGPVVAQHS